VVIKEPTSSPTSDTGAATAATSPSAPSSTSATACPKGGDHQWSYVGVVFETRRTLFERRKIQSNVYRCKNCKKLGTGKPLLFVDQSTFGRNIVELPEFQEDARSVFGWSLRDRFKKDGGDEKL
jgi:hypothetical protein